MGAARGVAAGCRAARADEHALDAQSPDLDLSGGARRGSLARSLPHRPAAADLRALCPAHAQAAGGHSDALHASADQALAHLAGAAAETAGPDRLLRRASATRV